MTNVKIKIPTNLTPQQEAIEISKKLLKSSLLENKSKILIGLDLEVQKLKTTIEIERIAPEPIMSRCSVCDCNFEEKIGKKLFTNYGGRVKQITYCSEICRDEVILILPSNRYSLTKSKLKKIKFY